jgi:hypothetical protein
MQPYLLRKVAWEGPLEAPGAWCDSPWSVELINRGGTPWLIRERYTEGPPVLIMAGTPLPEFVRLVEDAGGAVYLRHGDSTP